MSEPTPIPRVSAKKYRGLGDVVEAAAKPVLRAASYLVGKELKPCAGCNQRREALNRMVPFDRRPRS